MRRAGGDAVWWCALLVLCLVLLAPLTFADVPPLLDYPNHLARLFVLASIPADPVLARFYQSRWGIIPNLALDLTVPPLLRILPVHIVGRAVAGLILVLPVLGAAAYHRALNGRLSYWALTAVLFAFNATLLRGFLNFIAALGLALLCGAAWVAWRERRPSLALLSAAAGAVALFFCHLTGLLFFAILIGGHELAWLWAACVGVCGRGPANGPASGSVPIGDGRPLSGSVEGRDQLRLKARRICSPADIIRRAAAVIAVFAVPAALYMVSDLSRMAGEAEFRSAADKANVALSPVINYVWPLDLFTASLCAGVPVLCLAARWCTIQFQAAAAIVVLLLLFIGLPAALKGTYDLDTRFIIMAAFMIPAAVTPAAHPRRVHQAIAAGFLLLFAARMTVFMTVWGTWPAELAAFRNAIAPTRPGDVVMTVRTPRPEEPGIGASVASARRLSDGTSTDTHLPGLLVVEHRAYWPFLFDNVSQQPIQTREPYRAAANLVDNSPDPIALLLSGEPGMWPFSHVLVLGPVPPDIPTGGLKLLVGNSEATLFAVMRDEIDRAHKRSAPPAQ